MTRGFAAGGLAVAAVLVCTTAAMSGTARTSAQPRSALAASEQIGLVVQPSVTWWGRPISIIGQIEGRRPDRKVTVQFDECGGATRGFVDVAETTTRDDGSFSVNWLRGRASGAYRAVSGNSVSKEVSVRARPDVLMRRHHDDKVSVWVTATVPFYKKRVILQRLIRRTGTWVTVRTVPLTRQMANNPGFGLPQISTGAEELRVRVPKRTTLRAVLPLAAARPCYLASYSKTVSVRA